MRGKSSTSEDADRSSWSRSWHADASLPVRRYMQTGMQYVGMNMRADRLVQFMWDAGLTEVPVLDDARRPVGLVSMGDLVAAVEGDQPATANDNTPIERFLERPLGLDRPAGQQARVRDIMVFGIATVHESLPLANAAARMLRTDRECLMVVDDDGVAVGSLSMRDIMRWLVEQTATDETRSVRGEMVTPALVRR